MNQNNWKTDKQWSDVFIPEIKSILGLYLIGEPPVEEDQKRNTDLIILKMDAVRIGCRVRRPEYIEKYRDEFTIRAGRPSGATTELTKIIMGWGDYFFYGISDYDEATLKIWHLCDYKIFRLWFNRQLVSNKGVAPGIAKSNKDNSSSFLAFKFNQLPTEFVIAKIS